MSLIDKIIAEWLDHMNKGNKTLGTLPTDWEIELEQYVRDNQTSYYLVFAGNLSHGEVPMGAESIVADFETLEEAEEYVDNCDCDWWQIFNPIKNIILKRKQ